MEKALLELNQIGQTDVELQKVNLTIMPTDFVAIVGLNSVNKHALIEFVTGSRQPKNGEVNWTGTRSVRVISQHNRTDLIKATAEQRFRLALARSLVNRPSLLILDDPFGSLNMAVKRELYQLVNKIGTQMKAAVLLLTHDVNEAARMAQRVIGIRNGSNQFEECGARGCDEQKIDQVTDSLFNDLVNVAY
ncbi:putative ABC transporter ATP-binding protein [Paucilactobacillus hokkaidonensis JCM 18461]|nr:hypothetical protein [Paucilactobacillus hokkaidonensis]BAP84920.1 putative ABC transporter ATP-binding protein [Paucilactobacillus hokkaidonensis JCM 18461]